MKNTERRTQLYLTAEQHRAVRDLAHRKGTSLAGVVREALTEYLRREESGAGMPWKNDPFLAAIGTFELPPLAPGESLDDAIDRTVYDEEVGPWSSLTLQASSPPSTPGTAATTLQRARSEPSP